MPVLRYERQSDQNGQTRSIQIKSIQHGTGQTRTDTPGHGTAGHGTPDRSDEIIAVTPEQVNAAEISPLLAKSGRTAQCRANQISTVRTVQGVHSRTNQPIPSSTEPCRTGHASTVPTDQNSIGRIGEKMGTNYYWAMPRAEPITLPTGATVDLSEDHDHDDPRIHIGKRSAAGLYCWDCRQTLCKEGEAAIHGGRAAWSTACPSCGKTKEMETINTSSVGMELGFAPAKTRAPTGVRSASSFRWAQDPEAVGTACSLHPGEEIIVNEYGDRFTGQAFLEMLACNCPIQFTNSIGIRFL